MWSWVWGVSFRACTQGQGSSDLLRYRSPSPLQFRISALAWELVPVGPPAVDTGKASPWLQPAAPGFLILTELVTVTLTTLGLAFLEERPALCALLRKTASSCGLCKKETKTKREALALELCLSVSAPSP